MTSMQKIIPFPPILEETWFENELQSHQSNLAAEISLYNMLVAVEPCYLIAAMPQNSIYLANT